MYLLVSFDIYSKDLSLAEITAALGVEPTLSCSHERGSPRGSRHIWDITVWRCNSSKERDEDVSLEENVQELIDKLCSRWSQASRQSLANCEAFLNVAFFIGIQFPDSTEEPVATSTLPASQLEALGKAGVKLDITTYVTIVPE